MQSQTTTLEPDDGQIIEPVGYDFGLSRRTFVQVLGAGLLIAVSDVSVSAQRRPRFGGGGQPVNVAARVHVANDGTITVLTGKVEAGQGSRAEITQAAAEELRVPAGRVQLIMADTGQTPDDGITAGSRTSPSTIPSVRNGCAAAREMLLDLAAKQWGGDRASLHVEDGKVAGPGGKELTYADLARDGAALDHPPGNGIAVTPEKEWKVLGTGVSRPNGRDLVTGRYHYPSDITRPGMLHGKVLRPPTYGAKLVSVDLSAAKALPAVVVVHDEQLTGVAAPTTLAAEEAIAALEKSAKWEPVPQPSSDELYAYLRAHAHGGVPKNPFADEVASAAKTVKQTYTIPYIQHAPMEPRAAVAEWEGGKLTVWAGTQNPFGHRGELARAFHLSDDRVRVIVPDVGGGFGGKHTGECAVEAARLAQAAGKPVSLRWTREEEFTFAYFRPAAVIDAEATLDASGQITSWHFVNINSGQNAVEPPYRVGKNQSRFVPSDPPLRHGSYRALASTANIFARECFMDELAEAAGRDPLAFRLAHLEDGRLKAVLEAAADKFGWAERVKQKEPNVGVGLSCGTEKGSFVAACAEVVADPAQGKYTVRRVCQAYECGAIMNPGNLLAQVQGAIVMGLGAVLREGMRFENGKMLNASFARYRVPRFRDVPQIEVHLLDRPDLPSAGAGETPITAVAPAVANAVSRATGTRVRDLPVRLSAGDQARAPKT